ncbi:hypothetical protein [Kitasatospora sp. NPDC050543]|uniref:hypothetical protein n=1 Tax=Kitasatospora sp. NPDC050543 TaxID=3364054 RepID=UPI0037BDFAF3
MPRFATIAAGHGRGRPTVLLRQAGYGLLSSYQDYRAQHTWWSWLFGWLVRLVCQVLFFSMVGRLVGSPELQRSIAVGNAVLLGPLCALGVVSSSVGERRGGTLPFLLLSIGGPFPALAARGLYWAVDGALTSCIALFALPALVGLSLSPAAACWCAALIVLTALSGYALALGLAGVSLRWPESRMYLTAGTTILLMALTGVNAPSPETGAAGTLAGLLPATHGLGAVRAVIATGNLPAGQVLGECLVLVGWGAVGVLALTTSLRHQVRTGSLDLG